MSGRSRSFRREDDLIRICSRPNDPILPSLSRHILLAFFLLSRLFSLWQFLVKNNSPQCWVQGRFSAIRSGRHQPRADSLLFARTLVTKRYIGTKIRRPRNPIFRITEAVTRRGFLRSGRALREIPISIFLRPITPLPKSPLDSTLYLHGRESRFLCSKISTCSI